MRSATFGSFTGSLGGGIGRVLVETSAMLGSYAIGPVIHLSIPHSLIAKITIVEAHASQHSPKQKAEKAPAHS